MTSDGAMEGENVIIFSSDDWASGLKTSKYHIARHLARRNRVLFVNSVGLRAATASGRDVRRAASKLAAFFRGPQRAPEGLHVYTPVVLPFLRGRRPVAALNGLLLRGAMAWIQHSLSLTNPIVFAFVPTFNDVVGRLGGKAIVYYCIDDLRGYAGVDRGWFDAEEERLLRRADCVIASSAELQKAFAARGHRAWHVPHGVDWDLFRTAVTEELPVPHDLRGVPEPRLGFYGFLSDEWLDYELLKKMAAAKPQWHIVLIGRPRAGMDVDAPLPEPNIHWLGLRPFEELPAYTRHFAVGLIPFRLNLLTRHSNPLKLLEYLSGGLPVVSTDIPEVRKFGELVHIARSHEEFIAQCERSLAEGQPADREKRSLAMRQHSWERRIEQISEIVGRAATGSSTMSTGPGQHATRLAGRSDNAVADEARQQGVRTALD